MIALVAAIFVASLLGSLHCAGMCGAFVAIACGGAETNLQRAVTLQCAYHGGRLLTYLAMGVAAGFTGQLIDLAGALAGIEPVAAILAGATMVIFAIASLAKLRGMRVPLLHPPQFMSRWLAGGHRAAMGYSPVARAGLIGLLTTLLPCGWLYAFVVTAAGTAHPLSGALAMFVFWAGTLPMLVTLGAGVQKLTGAFGRRLPAMTCIILLVVGLYTLVGRSFLNPIAIAQQTSSAGISPANAQDAHATEPPCCQK